MRLEAVLAIGWFMGSGCATSYALHQRAAQHNATGVERLAAGDEEGAASAFRLALEYNPRFSEPYNNLALVAMENGDWDDAEDLLERALRLNPDFAEAWTNLGALRLRRGDPVGASEALREALAADPGQDDARYDLVLALLDAGAVNEAWEHVLRLDTSSPGDPRVLALASWVAARMNRPLEAVELASRALDIDPASPLAHLTSGAVAALVHDYDLAEYHLATAVASGTAPPAAQLLLGAVEAELGRTDVAAALLDDLISSEAAAPEIRAEASDLLDVLTAPARMDTTRPAE